MRNRPLLSVCLILSVILCILILLRGSWWLPENQKDALENIVPEDTSVGLTGTVYKVTIKSSSKAIYLKDVIILVTSDSDRKHEIHLKRFLIYVDPEETCHIGNRIYSSGDLSYFHTPRNPGNFDQKFYYSKQKIAGYLYAEQIKITDDTTAVVSEHLRILREKWSKLLMESMENGNGEILSAILLGEKSKVDEELKELYQLNGIGHVLAVSGVHLSIIGISIYQVLRRVTGSYPIGGAAGILFMGIYILMIGFTVSGMRAFIMFLFRVGADIAGRKYDACTALGVSAFLILLVNPMFLYDSGFWLSYGAIMSILLILPVFQPFHKGTQKKYDLKFLLFQEGIMSKKTRNKVLAQFRMNLLESFFASLSIQIFLLPVQVYYYYEIAPFSILLNLIVIPLMSVIMIAGIVGSVSMIVCSEVAVFFFSISSMILDFYQSLCRLMLKVPGSRLVVGQPRLWQMSVYYLVLFLCLLVHFKRNSVDEREERNLNTRNFMLRTDDSGISLKHPVSLLRKEEERKLQRRKKKKRDFRWWIITIAIYLTLLLLLLHRFGEEGTGKMTVLDVGQGDCIYLKSPDGIHVLVDGGSSSEKNVGKYRMEPYLEYLGVGCLDYVFVTHGDEDHMNGIQEMIDRQHQGIKIRNLVLPDKAVWDENLKALASSAEKEGICVLVMEQSQTLKLSGFSITCLYPEQNCRQEAGNSTSLVLQVLMKEKKILLTGDLEGEGEERVTDLLQKLNMTYDILKVAHHGSKNSTSEKFLNVIQPSFALISAGINNRYGHPHQETLDRLKNVGCKVISTVEDGAIEISFP